MMEGQNNRKVHGLQMPVDAGGGCCFEVPKRESVEGVFTT